MNTSIMRMSTAMAAAMSLSRMVTTSTTSTTAAGTQLTTSTNSDYVGEPSCAG